MPRVARLFIVVATLTSCAYHNPAQPTPPAISESAPAFLTLGVPTATTVSAYVQNERGAPLGGVVVKFASDVGTLSPTSASTAANGRAETTVTASAAARITATAGALTARALVAAPVTPTPNPTPTPTPTPSPGPSPTPTPPAPSVFLNVSTNATTGVPLVFGVSSAATGVTWQWTFGDGATAQTTAFSTSHTYTVAGSYTATVSAAGLPSASATITVTDPAPAPPPATPSISVALVANPTSVALGVSSILTATATLQNGAPAVTSYKWDCKGDGVTIITTFPPTNSQACAYPTVGLVTSRVTVTGGSVTGSGSTVVTVTQPILTVSVVPTSFNPSAIVADTFTATVTSTGPVPATMNWQWDDTNDGTFDVTHTGVPSPDARIITFGSSGTKTVRVVVTDPATGRTATGLATVTAVP